MNQRIVEKCLAGQKALVTGGALRADGLVLGSDALGKR